MDGWGLACEHAELGAGDDESEHMTKPRYTPAIWVVGEVREEGKKSMSHVVGTCEQRRAK